MTKDYNKEERLKELSELEYGSLKVYIRDLENTS